MIKAFIKRSAIVIGLLLIPALVFVYLHLPEYYPPSPAKPNIVNDASALNETSVSRIIRVTDSKDVIEGIRYASDNGLEISVSGKKHTMGGHAFYRDAVLLDMSQFNKILSLDSENRILIAQSGATWNDVQEYLNPHNLAVISMQGPNIFTIGGSVSVNAHGWDKSREQVSSSVKWFDLALADGSVVRCSKNENTELFRLAMGGFGLFGVILDVGFRVTDNSVYKMERELVDYHEFPNYFQSAIRDNPAVALAYADCSIASSSFLEEALVTSYITIQESPDEMVPLISERNIIRDRLFLNLSRKYDWGKTLRWYLQKKRNISNEITRNNAMRSPFQRLIYYSSEDTDILQEYFIPVKSFVEFADSLRLIIKRHDANLINCTIRYISRANNVALNYAKSESFAFVLYFNIKKDVAGIERDKIFTRKLVDVANTLGGTFYLSYLPHYDLDQIRMAYPEIDEFFAKKKSFDPDERFKSKFYENYGMTASAIIPK